MIPLKRLILPILFLLAAGPARAQDELPIEISMGQFGVGSIYRPGDFTSVRLDLTSNLPEAATVHVVLERPDATGDIVEYSRTITLNPRLPQSAFLYIKTLPTITTSTNMEVHIYEDEDGVRGGKITAGMVSPAMIPAVQRVADSEALIGVIGGPKQLGLRQYTSWGLTNSGGPPLSALESTRIVTGLGVRDLPDRWEGLDGFEALVWSNESPGGLTPDHGRALRDYIFRGGHLVIVLPEGTNPWGLGETIEQTPLHDLLPRTSPRIDQDVLVRDMLPFLSKSTELRADAVDLKMSIRVFDTLDNYYKPLIAFPKPDRRVVAIQRTYGYGLITLIGIDLVSPRLDGVERNHGSLPEADVFWNRVLGRRQDTPAVTDLRKLDNITDSFPRLKTSFRATRALRSGPAFAESISLSGSAFAGLGLAVLLFLIYWAVAGPLGFAVLKSMKLQRHAWVIFALTGMVFTAVAWGGVWALRENNVRLKHITVLDLIARPADEVRPDEPYFLRATTWFSVYLPGYGETPISIASDPGQRDLLAPLSAPGVQVTPFRNISRYEIPVNSPALYEVPVRATTKEFYARWMGALDPEWGGMFQVVTPIRVTRNPQTGVPTGFSGEITHNLPAPLEDITIFLIDPRRSPAREYFPFQGDRDQERVIRSRGAMLNSGQAWSSASWSPGQVFDLANPNSVRGNQRSGSISEPLATHMEESVKVIERRGQNALGGSDYRLICDALSFFQAMKPPEYIRTSASDSDEAVWVTRRQARELDLSNWLNRPCIIIIGYLENSEIPVPLEIGGNKPDSDGITVVRWIYPLPVEIDDVAADPRTTAFDREE